jgi:hypothetical protein
MSMIKKTDKSVDRYSSSWRLKYDQERNRKILNYRDLTTEVQRMCNVKTKVISVTIGTTITISTSFRQYLSNVPVKHDIKELQITAILSTAHVLRKVLM